MLEAKLKEQLRAYLERVTQPVELIAHLDDGDKSRDMDTLLQEIAELSTQVSVRYEQQAGALAGRTPSFAIRHTGTDADTNTEVWFAGIPLGHEFTSLVLALLQVGGHPPRASAEVIEQIRALDGDYQFETYYSLSCQNCPDVVQALNLMSVINPRIRHVAIDGALFQDEVEAREVMAVPSVYLNGEPFAQGRMNLDDILAKLDTSAEEKAARRLNDEAPYDVLIIGGGPGGSAAAVYAARKGIRTGIAAERFGGQVEDTLGIENFISVPYTEGPKLTAALEQHVTEYGVDIMDRQRAERLIPAAQPGGLHRVELASGATLQARSLILSTGARWRQLGVTGEDTYRNKGVAYCPHCDGPLFKGKHVAVIGGGNSGVEAAIDLAGIVERVTVLEFADELKADSVLQKKLHSLANVEVILSAQTTAITGDGSRVTGLDYSDRLTGESQHVALAGVFVQIGLMPNTEWLQDTLALSQHGEIEVDARGATSIPGIFAAGDATTVPYKQIVIAMGEGSKAALGAFDYLIRNSVDDADDNADQAAA